MTSQFDENLVELVRVEEMQKQLVVRAPVAGMTFYRVDIALALDQLDRLGESDLIPGMPVEVYLLSGRRSVLSF